MKFKILFASVLLGFFSFINFASAGWDLVSPSPTTLDLHSVHYLAGSNDAYSVGNTGVGIKSTDNGASWSAMNTGLGTILHKVYFPNSSIGYFCGNNGNIYKTTDAGVSWVEQSSGITVNINDLHFSSINHGIAVGALGKIYYTNDGGTNWSEVSSGVNTDLKAVFLVNSTVGYACGIGGNIIKTTNGGLSWGQTTSGTNVSFNDIYFTSELIGYVVGDGGKIMKTTNGMHWGFLASGTTNNLNGVTFTSNATQGYVVGDAGTIVYTSNSGNNWGMQTSASSNNLYSVSFKNQQEGIIVGGSGLIMKTTDGGGSAPSTFINITYPAGGEYLAVGDIENITWSASANIDSVRIYFSDDGITLVPVDTVKATDGTFSWTVPTASSTTCYIVLEATNLSHQVFSGVFTVSTTSITVSQPNTPVHWQVGSTQNITWTMDNVTSVQIEYSTDGGTSWVVPPIATGQTSSPYNWTPVPNTTSDQCLVRVMSEANNTIFDVSDELFTIPDIEITAPVAGSGIELGLAYTIAWNSAFVDTVNIVYSTDGVNFLDTIAVNVPAVSGSVQWTVPQLSSANVTIRVYDKNFVHVLDEVVLNVLVHDITLSQPNGGEHIQAGANFPIDWNALNVQNLDIEFSSNGVDFDTVATSYDATANPFYWTVPEEYSETCLIRLTDSDYPSVTVESAAYFTIADLEITSPADGSAIVIGDNYDIEWTFENVEFVKIDYSTDGGASWNTIAAAVDATLGTHSWTPTGITANSILLRISDAAYSNINHIITLDVHIPSLSLTSPAGGEWWRISHDHEITWTAEYVDEIDIYFSSTGSGGPFGLEASNIDASLGTWTWTAPGNTSNNCFIKIQSSSNPALFSINPIAFNLTSNYVEILSPNGGEQWDYNSVHDITWESNGVTNIDLQWSVDGGLHYTDIPGATNIPATGGFFSWTIPKTPSDQCRIRARDHSVNAINDESDMNFDIAVVEILTPNGGENILINSNYSITWESNLVDNLDFYYSTDAGSSWNLIEANYPASAPFYSWSVPNTPSPNYLISAFDSKKSSISDTSDAVFKVSGIVLTYPDGGEELVVGRTYDIEWESANVNNVKIQYSTDGGLNWITIISHTAAAPKKYSWKIPKTPSEECLVRISDVDDPSTVDESNDLFAISGQGLILTNPIGGNYWIIGNTYNITWESINVEFVNIQYSIDGKDGWQSLPGVPSKIDASLGTYSWTVPPPASTECLIRITDVSNPMVMDQSASYFKIGGVEFSPPSTWDYTSMTGMSSTIIVPYTSYPLVGGRDIQTADAIGLFYDDNGTWKCAGYAIWQNSTNLAITVWGNNPRTTDKDGYNINEDYVFKVWDAQTGTELFAQAKFSSGNPFFTDNGISVVSGLRSHIEFDITLQGGVWSLISSYLLPANSNLENMMSGVVDELDYMKDDEGQIYFPAEGINTIQTWDINKGYQVYMNETATLTVLGSNIDPAGYCMEIQGMSWYIISYLPDQPMAIATALATLSGNILLVKDMYGNIYYPAYGIDQIVTMQPGQGYQIILYNDDTLCYPENTKYAPRFIVMPSPDGAKYNCDISGTGSNSTLVVNSANSPEEIKTLKNGDELAVFTKSGLIVACGKVINGQATMTVWGDNNRTSPEVEGALNEEQLELRIWDHESNNEYTAEITSGANLISGKPIFGVPRYQQDGIWMLNVLKDKVISGVSSPNNSGLEIRINPNPVAERLIVYINSDHTGELSLNLLDLTGEKVYTKSFGQINGGIHTYDITLNELQSGVYILVAEIGGIKISKKVIVIK